MDYRPGATTISGRSPASNGRLAAILLLALLLIVSSLFVLILPVQAGEPPARREWPSHDPEYSICDTATPGQIAAIKRAAEQWTNVTCSCYSPTFAGLTNCTPDNRDNVNCVCFCAIDGVGGTLGETHSWSRPGTNGLREIVEVDIHMDRAETWDYATTCTPGKFHAETALKHEFGHFAGLGHSDQQPAVMFATLGNCTVKHLGADDIAGIQKLYPSPHPVPSLAWWSATAAAIVLWFAGLLVMRSRRAHSR